MVRCAQEAAELRSLTAAHSLSTNTMPDLFLSPHVHYCRRGDAVILLDLRGDDYLLLDDHVAQALIAQSIHNEKDGSCNSPDPSVHLHELLDLGLLTTDPQLGKQIREANAEIATEALLAPGEAPDVKIRAGNVWNFLVACATAALALRWLRLEHTVNRVRRRKQEKMRSTEVDVQKARYLTAVFRRLRLFFPRNYLCLYDSLALVEFLARYDVFPTWVFAVKLEPWAAHCWIQSAPFTFNEGVEEAAQYTPIMSI